MGLLVKQTAEQKWIPISEISTRIAQNWKPPKCEYQNKFDLFCVTPQFDCLSLLRRFNVYVFESQKVSFLVISVCFFDCSNAFGSLIVEMF
jgi:hypothetical protein